MTVPITLWMPGLQAWAQIILCRCCLSLHSSVHLTECCSDAIVYMNTLQLLLQTGEEEGLDGVCCWVCWRGQTVRSTHTVWNCLIFPGQAKIPWLKVSSLEAQIKPTALWLSYILENVFPRSSLLSFMDHRVFFLWWWL